MADQTVSYLLQAKTQGLSDLQLFRNELAQLKQIQSGFRADVGFGQQQVASVRAATQALTEQVRAVTQLTAALRAQGRYNTVFIKFDGVATAINDVVRLRTILGSLQNSSNIRITADVQALQAVNTQISTQIAQLTALIAQLRGLGAGGGNGGGRPALPAGVQATLLEIERLNNLWTRGQISAQNYNQALTGMQSRLEAARSAAGRGTTEFAQIDRQITKLTQSLRGINTDSLVKIRADMAAVRSAFDQATGGISRDSQQFRDAAAVWQAGASQIEARLRALVQQGNLTAAQMGQVNRTLGTLAREQGTLTGGLNPMGLSGNAFNAIRAAFPLLMQAGGSLGAAAVNANMFGQGLASAGAAAGPMGIAVAGVVTTLVGFVKVAGDGLEQVKQLGNAFAVLKANGETNLAGVSAGLDRLKESGNKAAETFTKGQLGAALADVVKAGVSTSDAMRLMATSTRLAASENQDLTVSSSMLLKNLRQYQLGVGDAAKVGDMLAQSGLLAAGSVADLSTGMGIVAGTGRAARVEMYDLLGMLVELDNKGMSAADVGANGLRAALAALAGITDKGRASLHALGIETVDGSGHARAAGDIMVDLAGKLQGMGIKADASTGQLVGNGDALAKVSDIMDTRAAAAILNLTGDWRTYGEQIRDSQGKLTSYSNTMLDTLDGNQRRMTASLKDLGGNITKFLAEPITNAANAFNDLITQLNGGTAGFSQYLQQAGIDGTTLDGQVNAHLQALFQQRKVMEDRLSQLDAAPLLKLAFQGQYEEYSKRLPGIIAEMKRIVADARAGRTTNLTTTGSDGGQLALDPTIGSKVIEATRKPLNDQEAQAVVDRCDKYVRLVLGRAFPSIANQINTLFQSNPGRGGIPTAVTSAANLQAAGLLKPFAGTSSLKPGDVIFYTDRGQNHTGVWLGQGNYVRGNNRVTYNQTGGKTVVGDVDISALGTPTSVLSVAELAARYGVKVPPVPQPSPRATPAAATPPATDPNAAIKKLQAEGLHLYAQYEAALASGNAVWRDKAKMAVDAFKKENKAVWDGILRDHKDGGDAQVAITSAQVAKAQQLVAALKKAQEGHDPKVIDAARVAMERWSKASESNARALSAVQDSQKGVTGSAREYIASAADLRKYGDEALGLIKRQEEAVRSGDAARIESARGAVTAFTQDSKMRAAVLSAEQVAYQSRQQTAAQTKADQKRQQQQDEQDATKARARAASLAADLRAGKVTAAQQALDQVQGLEEKELAGVKDNAVRKLEVVTRYANLRYQATEVLAARTRDAALREAQNKYTDDPENLQLAQQNIRAAYDNALAKAANARSAAIAQATKDQTSAVQQQRDAYSTLADSIRTAIAQGTFDEAQRQAALVSFNALGRASERLGLTHQTNVEGARKATYALIQEASGVDRATAAYEAYWQAQADHQDTGARADAGMRGSYGVGQEGLQAALLGSGANAQLLGDPQAALADLEQFNRDAADRIRRVYADALAEFQNFHDNLNAGILETTTAAYAQIKQTAADEQAAADDAGTTVESLTTMLQGVLANGLDPQTGGYVQLLDDLIARGGQAGEAAKQVKDNLDQLINTTLAPSLQDVLDNPEAYADGAPGKDASAPDPSVVSALRGQLDSQRTAAIKDMTDVELAAAAAFDQASGDGKDLALVLGEIDSRATAAKTALEALPAARLQVQLNALDRAHAAGRSTPENELAYANERERLQRDLENAQYAVSSARLTGAALEAAQLQHEDRLTQIHADGEAARTAIDQKATTQAADKTEAFMAAQKLMSDGYRALGQAQGETVGPNQALIDQLSSLSTVAGIDQTELAGLITKLKELDQQTKDRAGLDSFISGIESLGQAFGGTGTAAGAALTSIGGALKLSQSITAKGELFDQTKAAFSAGGSIFDKLGAAGGWLGAISTGIGLIGSLGDAIMGLSPAYQLWKKNTLEQASAEQAAAGSRTYGNIANPYFEKLQADAAALTTKANAGFWQQLGWAIFGGAPETLSKAASDSLVRTSNIFADYANSVNSDLESTLMNAFDSGDFSGVGDALTRSLGKVEAKIALAALIAKSNITEIIQRLAEDTAAGLDTTADLAALNGAEQTVTQQFQAIAPSFAGYGASAATGISTGGSGTTFGAVPPAIQLAISTPLMDAATLYDTASKRFDWSTVRFDGSIDRFEAALARGLTIGGQGSGSSSLPLR